MRMFEKVNVAEGKAYMRGGHGVHAHAGQCCNAGVFFSVILPVLVGCARVPSRAA